MNKLIIGIIVGILVLGGLAWIARPSTQNTTPAPTNGGKTLTVEEANNYDFGVISMAAGNVVHQFKVKNSGTGPVKIDYMYTSCMCTTASITFGGRQFGPYGMPGHGFTPKINEVISSEEEAIVEVVFDPAAHGPAGVGPVERAVYIEADNNEVLELLISAIVTP